MQGNPKSLTFHPSEEILKGCSLGKRLNKSLNIILNWDLLVNWVSPAKPNTIANTLYMSHSYCMWTGKEERTDLWQLRVRGIEGKWERKVKIGRGRST